MTSPKLMLDYIYEHEKNLASQVYLTQPLGQGRVVDYTWGQTMDQARRMATHLQSLGFGPGARIGPERRAKICPGRRPAHRGRASQFARL